MSEAYASAIDMMMREAEYYMRDCDRFSELVYALEEFGASHLFTLGGSGESAEVLSDTRAGFAKGIHLAAIRFGGSF